MDSSGTAVRAKFSLPGVTGGEGKDGRRAGRGHFRQGKKEAGTAEEASIVP